MFYAKEFNKWLVSIIWIFAIFDLILVLMSIPNEIRAIKMFDLPYGTAFISLIGTVINAYAILKIVLKDKNINGVWIFVLSHILSFLITFFILREYISSISISDTEYKPMLVKVIFFLIILFVKKNGVSAWSVLKKTLADKKELSKKEKVLQKKEEYRLNRKVTSKIIGVLIVLSLLGGVGYQLGLFKADREELYKKEEYKKKLHKTLSEKVVGFTISYEDFKKDMQDPTRLKRFYGNLQKRNLINSNLTYEGFAKNMGHHVKNLNSKKEKSDFFIKYIFIGVFFLIILSLVFLYLNKGKIIVNNKFIIIIILGVGFLIIGYLYALGNRYKPMDTRGLRVLDTWTGEIYRYDGVKLGDIGENE